MKAYTDINQSKKLAKILPLESADGFWEYHFKRCSEGDEWEGYKDYPTAEPYLTYTRKVDERKEDREDIPCWSLAALLDVMKEPELVRNSEGTWLIRVWYKVFPYCVRGYSNPVDACVAMIEILHKQNLL